MDLGLTDKTKVYSVSLVDGMQNHEVRLAGSIRLVLEKTVLGMLLACCFGSAAQSQQTNRESATLRGTVLLSDSQGQSAAVGAKVKLTGPVTLEEETDEGGEFVLLGVPYGTYVAEIASPGLKTVESIQVNTRNVEVSIELKPEQVVTSVVVSAAPPETKNPAPS
jgi:hypothetical protein